LKKYTCARISSDACQDLKSWSVLIYSLKATNNFTHPQTQDGNSGSMRLTLLNRLSCES